MRETTMALLRFSRCGRSGTFLALILLTAYSSWVQAQETPGNNRPTREDGSPLEPIDIDFDDVTLLEVVNTIGALTGRNFETDPSLKTKKVTIISHHKIPPELAYDLLEAILYSNDFAMVDTLDGNLVRIVPKPAGGQANIGSDKLEIFNNTRTPHMGFDNFAIHIVQLEYVPAQEAADFLQRVGSPNAEFVVFQNTNTLLIIDTADGIRNIFEVIETIDIPGYETELEIFPLEFTRAEALADQLNQVLLTGPSAPSRPGQPVRPVQPRNPRTANVPGQVQTKVIGNAEETLRMVPDERLNSLIVVASASMMEQVRYMIGKLDTATPYDSNNMHYVPLMHTKAEDVAAVLNSVTSTGPREGATASANSGEVQPFEKKVTITPYEDNNALVIIASPQDFAVLEGLIAQLDTPRKQVNIETLIMEVKLGSDWSLQMEATAVDSDHVFGLANVINIAQVIAGGPSALQGPGGTIGVIDGTTDIMVDGVSQTVQNVPFLLKALETITDVEILSRPNLLMKDNTEGSLFVGSDIPIPTSQSDINPNSGFQSRNSIARREVGITLNVKPQINEGEYVSMEIEVESSNASPGSIGIDVNTSGATILESKILTEVVVRDGQTGILGGLIGESQNRVKSQVPILGDIPILGMLFRGKTSGRERTNLVILVTPHIIGRDEDMVEITRKRMEDYYTYDLDPIFEKGFIKKVKAKYRIRTKNRPTEVYRSKFTDVDPVESSPREEPVDSRDDTSSSEGNRGVIFRNDTSSEDDE